MRALRFHRARELAVEKVAEPGSPGPGGWSIDGTGPSPRAITSCGLGSVGG